MKKFVFVLLSILICSRASWCQNSEYQGKPIAEIFTDFHLNLNDTSNTTGFSLNRAYLGYKIMTESRFAGTIIVNAGVPDDLAQGSVPKRYAYFREASVSYTGEKTLVYLGITGTRLFDYQQKFWGKRYIANTYQSINGYGYVADLGVAVDYRFNDFLKADVTLMNGEGYSNVQLDNSLKGSAGFTITPNDEIAFRIYDDLMKTKGVWQNTFLVFLGYRTDKAFIGAEYTHKTSLDLEKGHNAFGISATAGIIVSRSVELFARYDYSTSTKISGTDTPWNDLLDGKLMIAGLQKKFGENVKIALDYQGHFPYSPENQDSHGLYLNLFFGF
jgi:hypothetical protein